MSSPDMDCHMPLTLQEQSFLFMVSHIRSYPASVLAMLPKRWRESLLASVPLYSLIQLERTEVARGIDTWAVWEAESSLLNSVWASYTLMDSAEDSWRDCFVGYLCHLLFNGHNQAYVAQRASELLFALHRHKLPTTTAQRLLASHVQSLFIPLPQSYYIVPFSLHSIHSTSVVDLVLFLIQHLALPKVVELNATTLESSPLWKNRMDGLFGQLLSNVRSLRLSACRSERFVVLVAIAAVVANPKPMLEWLELWDAETSVLASAFDLFSPPSGYSGLVRLTVQQKTNPPRAKPVRLGVYHNASSLGPSLSSMLSHQVALEQVTLHSVHCDSAAASEVLCSSLALLLRRPHFEKLTLQKFSCLRLSDVKRLVATLLAACPASRLTLCLVNCEVVSSALSPVSTRVLRSTANSHLPKLNPSRLDGFHKCLHLNAVEVPFELIEWLAELEFIYLNTLSLDGVYVTDYHACDLETVFAQHPRFCVKDFHVLERKSIGTLCS